MMNFTPLSDAVEIGQPVTCTVTCTVGGVLTDPTAFYASFDCVDAGVTATHWQLGVGSTGIVKTSTGVYTVTITPTAAGSWHIRVVGTGTCAFATAGFFNVNGTELTPP